MPDRAVQDKIASLLRSAVDRRVFPAAVAEVGSGRGVVWRGAFGRLTWDDGAEQADDGTIFDLASLTKPLATTTAILHLVEEGRLRLEDRVATVIDDWRGDDRGAVTVEHLLEHASGLSARLVDQPPHDRRAFEHEICTMPLEAATGSQAIYSDLGFILLGFIAERREGLPLRAQTRSLLATVRSQARCEGDECFVGAEVPPAYLRRTAPTRPLADDLRRGRRLVGEVHDNYAAALGGFAGHAGLFGTAPGVGALARVILRAARGDEDHAGALRAMTIARATRRSRVPHSSRALGWDTMLTTSSCGTQMSAAAFGHVGFTGTSLWIDPMRDRYYVLLTNRVCDGGTSDDMQQIRRAFHDACAPL
jgi:CubicO group peptidase (beta-lactamase class C family)